MILMILAASSSAWLYYAQIYSYAHATTLVIDDLRWTPTRIVNGKVYDGRVSFVVEYKKRGDSGFRSPLPTESQITTAIIEFIPKCLPFEVINGPPNESIKVLSLTPLDGKFDDLREEFATNITSLEGGREYCIKVLISDSAGNFANANLTTPYIRRYENITTPPSNSRFTYSYYNNLSSELEKPRYLVMNVSGFLSLAKQGKLPKDKVLVILRHDVDNEVNSAMKISFIEKDHNLTSTYYVRTRGPYSMSNPNLREWMKWLYGNNLEVGLHYENLFAANYNFTLAVKTFKSDLKLLRKMAPVVTVCSHGNSPNQKYINYEIFTRNYTTLDENGLVGEAYLTVSELVNNNGLKMAYLSDSGKKWNLWLENLINAEKGEVLYFLLHSDWWHD